MNEDDDLLTEEVLESADAEDRALGTARYLIAAVRVYSDDIADRVAIELTENSAEIRKLEDARQREYDRAEGWRDATHDANARIRSLETHRALYLIVAGIGIALAVLQALHR
jgi:hypothetical protein